MERGAAPEKPAVRRQQWTIVLDCEGQVDAVPKRHAMPEREVERAGKSWTHIQQAWRALFHELKSLNCLLGRNLFSAITLRHQACEFSKQEIGRDQRDFSRLVLLQDA